MGACGVSVICEGRNAVPAAVARGHLASISASREKDAANNANTQA